MRQATDYLQQYLRIDTTNPPGDVRRAVVFLTGILDQARIAYRLFASDDASGKLNVLARLPGSGQAKPILLLNHMDVVPVEAAKWRVDPFSGALRDGCVWGRGALDMKAMGIAELMVLLQLAKQRVPLARDVLWLGVCDEEVGGVMGARWMVEHHYAEMDPEFVLDEGGGGSRGLLAGPERIVFAPSVNEKQPVWLKLAVRAEGGHGSMPQGKTAIEILHRALGRLLAAKPSLECAEDHPVVALMRERLGRLPANRYTEAITKNTVTITSVQAGVGQPPQPNVIPSEATATLDCRLLPDVSVAEFLDRLRRAVGDDQVSVEVTYQPAEAGPTSSHQTRLFQAIEQAIGARYPEAVVCPQLLTGGTDSRFFRAKGAVAYGFEPMIITPDDLDLIHGHNERIRIDQFHQMVEILNEVVCRVACANA